MMMEREGGGEERARGDGDNQYSASRVLWGFPLSCACGPEIESGAVGILTQVEFVFE